MGVIILSVLLFFFLRRRHIRNNKYNAANSSNGIKEGKGRPRNQINLLPGGGLAGAGGGAARNGHAADLEEDGGAAQYPLAPRRSGAGLGGGGTGAGADADYEPVPYVLPPGEGSSPSEHGGNGSVYDHHHPRTEDTHGGAALGSKSAMAAMDRQNSAMAPNAPARFMVHEDAGSVTGGPDDDDDEGDYSGTEEETVDLPPQYNSLGVLVSPERRPSRRRSARRSGAGEGDATATARHDIPPPIPEDGSAAAGHPLR